MASHGSAASVRKFEPTQKMKTFAFAFTGLGALGFLVGLMQNPARLWPAYLTAFFFVACLSLGGLFFVAINNIAKAGWSVSIRRFAEALTAFFPVIFLGSLVLLAGLKHLYPWVDEKVLQKSELISGKLPYLNVPFLVLRLVIFAGGMWIFKSLIVGHSLKQDSDAQVSHTHRNVALSIAWVLFFALSFSLFSVDLLMSLLPTWYSTIWGVYCFAGMAQSVMALLILILLYIKKAQLAPGYVSIEHIHDCAKYLKGFTVFWAYIAFSQFLLIWYANIPEETEFYIMRAQNGWTAVTVSLLIFKFIVPFLALLPRWAKRSESHLVMVCALVLVMQYVDVYWMVFPNFNENHLSFGFYEVSMLLGFLGLFAVLVMRFLQRNSIVAVKDPRMSEALSHHVIY